jgi:serine/threonine-protein kinase PknG
VLSIDFRGYQGNFRFTLPSPEDAPLFGRYDSLYRFLLKGTAPDPDDRFQSAEEMADQLYGVLREVVAEQEGRPVPAPSKLFTAALRPRPGAPDWRALPRPQVSSDDPGAGYLATLAALSPEQLIVQLEAAPDRTVEVELRLAAARIETGDLDAAELGLAKIETDDPWEWRAAWYRGIAELVRGRPDRARALFETVYHAIPGELAPKLALALSYESAGDAGQAARWFDIVSRTDPSVTVASFGLARCRMELGDREGALAAYERVPESSSDYLDAQTARIRGLISGEGNGDGDGDLDSLLRAGSILDGLAIEGERRERMTADLLEAALRLRLNGSPPADEQARLAGHRLSEHDLRLGLERSYRALARRAGTRADRIELVDAANRTRPRTWT